MVLTAQTPTEKWDPVSEEPKNKKSKINKVRWFVLRKVFAPNQEKKHYDGILLYKTLKKIAQRESLVPKFLILVPTLRRT